MPSGLYIFIWSWDPVMKHSMNNISTVQQHQTPGVGTSETKSMIQVFTTNKTVCHPSFAVSCITYLNDCLQIHYCRAIKEG